MSLIHEAGKLAYSKLIYPRLVGGEAQQDREIAQKRTIALDERVSNIPGLVPLIEAISTHHDPRLVVSRCGLDFPNPTGIAAGLDKNWRMWTLGRTGFGHFERGSVTKKAYKGNDPVRVFVLEEDESAINRMGFPGDGTEEAAKKMQRLSIRRGRNYVAGLNISASVPSFQTGTEVEDIIAAYVDLRNTNFDYSTINISSPNTADLVTFTGDPEKLRKLLTGLNGVRELPQFRRAMLVKLGSDLERTQKQELTAVIKEEGLQGLVLTNTSTSAKVRESLIGKHQHETGGISGQAIRELSKDNVREFRKLWPDALIIGVGGIDGDRAIWQMIAAGADVTQSYTALFMRSTSSPFFSYRACQGLSKALDETRLSSIEKLRGSETPWPFN